MLLHENNQLADTNSLIVANQVLPESEDRWRSLEHQKLIQASLEGFWVASAKDARILEVNDVFCNMVGYSREELLAMCISDLEANESPAETVVHIKKVMGAGYDRFETRHRHKLGHLVDLEVSVSHSAPNGGVFFVFARDITERKRTEDALYFVAQRGWMGSAENFFDVLVRYLGETLGVDYVVIDRLDKEPGIAETVALYAKGAIVPNVQYPLAGTPCENVMGRKFCFYPQGIQQLFPDDTLLVEMGAESYAGIPLWDSAGQPIGLIAVMDCKPLADEAAICKLLQLVAIRAAAELERERSDHIQREREREFRTLAENSPDNIVRYDREGRAVYLNPVLEKTLGIAATNMIGKFPREIHPDGRYETYAQTIENTIASGEDGEIDLTFPGGRDGVRVHHVRMVAERDEKGEVVGVLAIGRDITERKQAEALLKERLCQIGELNRNLEESARSLRMQTEELAASQEHLKQTKAWYRSILHSAPDGMVVADARGMITQVNAQIEEMFGYAAGELVGQPVERLLPPDVRKGHVGKRADFAFATAGDNSKSVSARGLRGYRKDGGEFPVDVSLSRLPDTDEKKGYVCAAIRDITERKKMEQERLNHSRHLEVVSRSLVAAQEDARQRLACELHDRTSPNLAAIDINLNVIATEIAHGASTDLTERLEDIRALISDTSASIREIGAEMRPPLLDYAGLVAAMENHALLFARRTGIQVYFACKNKDTRYTPHIESLLFRIYQEALTNCSKHSSAKSVRISLCNDVQPNILAIADDGVGFDPAQLGKTRKIGLGLLNMREMAEVAGVKIAIESTTGKGTCITVEI